MPGMNSDEAKDSFEHKQESENEGIKNVYIPPNPTSSTTTTTNRSRNRSTSSMLSAYDTKDHDNDDEIENENEGLFALTSVNVPSLPQSTSTSFLEKSTSTSNSNSTSPTNSQDFIAEIMMTLTSSRLSSLRQAFENNIPLPALSKPQFVHVMSTILSTLLQKFTLTHGVKNGKKVFGSMLIEFFDRIDINGDGSVEWDEFTSYIVDTGMSSQSQNTPDSICQFTYCPLKNKFEGKTGQNHFISFVKYFDEVDAVCVVENESGLFRVYSSSLRLLHTVKVRAGCVHCIDYASSSSTSSSSAYGHYLVSSTDLTISYYCSHSLSFLRFFRMPNQNTTSLLYSPTTNLLYTGDTNGSVKAWDIDIGEERYTLGSSLALDDRNSGSDTVHKDIIMGMIELTGLEILATSSIDRTIKLWNLHTGSLKRTLIGHAKGVKQLCYMEQYKFLISVGFDFDVYVWNPYVGTLIMKLKDHTCSLCACDVFADTPILVTSDVEGMIKVWDVRNFKCVQTLKASEKSSTLLTSTICVHSTKKIVTVGRVIYSFDYEKDTNPKLTDEHPLVSVIYNPTTLKFISISTHAVKIWSTDGKVLRIYRNLNSGTDITCVSLDFRERKFLLGDHYGNLVCYDFLNGAEMKRFEYPSHSDRAHFKEVSKVVYCNADATVITASWDRSIAIHDELDPDCPILLRRINNAHASDITSLCYSHNLSLIATGSSDGVVCIWDYEFARLDGTLSGHNSAITCLLFLDPFPLLISCDCGGNCILWSMRPSRVKYKVVGMWRNRPGEKSRGLASSSSAAVLTMAVSSKVKEEEVGERERESSNQGDNSGEEDEKKYDSDDEDSQEPVATATEQHNETSQRWLERLDKHQKKTTTTDAEEIITTEFDEYTIFAGDEKGNVVVWDLLPILNNLMSELGEGRRGVGPVQTVDCANPHRHIVYDVLEHSNLRGNSSSGRTNNEESKSNASGNDYNTSSSDKTNFTTPTSITKNPPPINVINSWKAHKDSITSIQIIPSSTPPTILSGSTDAYAKIWGMSGAKMGVLRQGGSGVTKLDNSDKDYVDDGEWLFRLDEVGNYERRMILGGEIMSEVEGMEELKIDTFERGGSDDGNGEDDDEDDDDDGEAEVGGAMRGKKESKKSKERKDEQSLLSLLEHKEDSVNYRKTKKKLPVNVKSAGLRLMRK